MDFDATKLYLSAMWHEKSVDSKIKTGFASTPHLNDVFVEDFNNQFFNQDGNESAISLKLITFHLILCFNIDQLKRI